MVRLTQYARLGVRDLASHKYLFFTGKGGVGKTSVSCAVAVALADAGERVLLVSTDPASNLEDVFGCEVSAEGTPIGGCPGLVAMDVDPLEAAAAYREGVVGPFRGVLPDDAIRNIEEQLSGSCTVEIAAFDQFARQLTDPAIAEGYDHVIFDTAPTGHTLRMLELPSAWTSYLDENATGTSCLGQLSGLGERRESYRQAMDTLADPRRCGMVLVARPQASTLAEAERSRSELEAFGMRPSLLVVNGLLEGATDEASRAMSDQQARDMGAMPEALRSLGVRTVPLRPYNACGLELLRQFLSDRADDDVVPGPSVPAPALRSLGDLVDDLRATGKRVIFAMGKGGVGKTTVAVSVAKGLARRGAKVRLTTTDPADHLGNFDLDVPGLSVSHIDEAAELRSYQEEVLAKARGVMGPDDLAYVEEDLRSPCTQEIASFRAFADVVARADDEVVVIDTAPTGHTLLLLESALSYGTQIEHTGGDVPESVTRLLPRLHDASQTDVIIVTLPEDTPVYEAERLRDDLSRAGIVPRWWVVNQCLSLAEVSDPVLRARSASEGRWMGRVNEASGGLTVGIPWSGSGVPDER